MSHAVLANPARSHKVYVTQQALCGGTQSLAHFLNSPRLSRSGCLSSATDPPFSGYDLSVQVILRHHTHETHKMLKVGMIIIQDCQERGPKVPQKSPQSSQRLLNALGQG